jgi:hypothetical protein
VLRVLADGGPGQLQDVRREVAHEEVVQAPVVLPAVRAVHLDERVEPRIDLVAVAHTELDDVELLGQGPAVGRRVPDREELADGLLVGPQEPEAHPGEDGTAAVEAAVGDLGHEAGEACDVEHELGLAELGARGDLLAQARGPEARGRGERVLPAPIRNPGRGSTVRPDSRSPSLRIVRAAQTNWTLSRSNTGFASGWSPKTGWSPVSSSTLGMPSVAAAMRSDCRAIRLRWRQVSCITGSTPASTASRLPARLDSRTCAPWLSVTLAASTQPRSSAAERVIAARSTPRGGPISAVTANRPDAGAPRRPRAAGSRAGSDGGAGPRLRGCSPVHLRQAEVHRGPVLGRGSGQPVVVGPEALVAAEPVVDPGSGPGQAVVDRAL